MSIQLTESERTRSIVQALLAAIESRDLRAVSAMLSKDVTWQNVPHPAAVGHDAVMELLGAILGWSDAVHWKVHTSSYSGNQGWLERSDRFTIDGVEHAVECNGVFEVHATEDVVVSLRDYVDLGEWRGRVGPILQALAQRTALHVVQRHLVAVAGGNPVDMANDYAVAATLVRNADVYQGRAAITDYFVTVPQRLGSNTVQFGEPYDIADQAVTVPWQIMDKATVMASGHDRFEVEDGRIVRQTVNLDGDDF